MERRRDAEQAKEDKDPNVNFVMVGINGKMAI